jgi:hypothetical protein
MIKKTKKPARTARSRRRRTAQLAKKRAALKVARAGWTTTTNYLRAVEGKKAMLGLIVQPIENEYGAYWSASAIATPYVPGDGIGGLKSVLDNHAHKIIGDFPTLAKAKAACEAVAAEWKETEEVGDLCGCPEIGKAPEERGQSLAYPLFVDETTPKDAIDRARVCVDAKTHIVTKNTYGATGCPWTPPDPANPPRDRHGVE